MSEKFLANLSNSIWTGIGRSDPKRALIIVIHCGPPKYSEPIDNPPGGAVASPEIYKKGEKNYILNEERKKKVTSIEINYLKFGDIENFKRGSDLINLKNNIEKAMIE